jgi:hypothetical protein
MNAKLMLVLQQVQVEFGRARASTSILLARVLPPDPVPIL